MEIERASALFKKKYEKWINDPERIKSGYDYERTFVEMMQELESEVFEHSLGDIPVNRNAKKKSKPV